MEFRDVFATRSGAGYDSSSVFDVHRAVHRNILSGFTVVLAYISLKKCAETLMLTILLAIWF